MTTRDSDFCLYVRLYCPREKQDRLIASSVLPLLDAASNLPSFRRFFFVRYQDDGGPHLRLRFFGTRSFVLHTGRRVILEHVKEISARGRMKVRLSRYRRELRRYGGKTGMRIAEECFHASSIFACRLLESLIRSSSSLTRSEAAWMSLEEFCKILRLPPPASPMSGEPRELGRIRARILASWRRWLGEGAHKRYVRDFQAGLAHCRLEYGRHRAAIRESLPALANSYIHMHLNRMGIDRNTEIALMKMYSSWRSQRPLGARRVDKP